MNDTTNRTALMATLHCLAGCSIGEVGGLLLGTGFNWKNAITIPVSVLLAFIFGYSLSLLPVVRSGIPLKVAVRLVLAADTLSVLTMEIVDNIVMLTWPGALNAGLNNLIFWISMPISLLAAFIAAFPVNRYLLARGKGHALLHTMHGHRHDHQ